MIVATSRANVTGRNALHGLKSGHYPIYECKNGTVDWACYPEDAYEGGCEVVEGGLSDVEVSDTDAQDSDVFLDSLGESGGDMMLDAPEAAPMTDPASLPALVEASRLGFKSGHYHPSTPVLAPLVVPPSSRGLTRPRGTHGEGLRARGSP